MKRLEESKARSKKAINALSNKTSVLVGKVEEDILSDLSKRHKNGMDAVSGIINEVKKARELTEESKEKALRTLRKYFVSYHIRDNSDFVLGIVERCVSGSVDGSTLKSFLAALPEPEMFETVKAMKGCFIMDGKKKEI